jgi:hypothetical protein
MHYHLTLRRVRVTIIAVEKQLVLRVCTVQLYLRRLKSGVSVCLTVVSSGRVRQTGAMEAGWGPESVWAIWRGEEMCQYVLQPPGVSSRAALGWSLYRLSYLCSESEMKTKGNRGRKK